MTVHNITRVAAKELRYLAFSPVGWILLAVFCVQTASAYLTSLHGNYENFVLGRSMASFTEALYTSRFRTVYNGVIENIYLFIPLLTMAVFSRELQSGSVKLFLSAPLRSAEIVLGKYLAVAAYLLLFIAFLVVTIVISAFSVENFDFGAVIPGLLGIYLLACTYAAIGVFVSSLTQYQMIAAIVTLAILFVLSSIAGWFAATPVLNEITFWASMAGRAGEFRVGLIGTNHLFYFLAIIAVFLGFTILRIANLRTGDRWTVLTAKGGAVVVVVVVVGWVLSLPQHTLYVDLTHDKRNSLAPESVALMDRLTGPWEIDTHANVFGNEGYISWPRHVIEDRQRWAAYARRNHRLTRNYRHYYKIEPDSHLARQYPGEAPGEITRRMAERFGLDPDTVLSPEQLQAATDVDLAAEDHRTFRVLRWNGERAVLRFFKDARRFPAERTRGAALKRLLDGPVTVGVATGRGERSIRRKGPADYVKLFTEITDRFALVNHGFNVVDLPLSQPVAADVDILLIADPRQPYGEAELGHVSDFVDRGGDMVLLVEGDSALPVDPILASLGLARGPVLRQPHDDYPETLILADHVGGVLNAYWGASNDRLPAGMPGAIELLTAADTGGFERTPIVIARQAQRVGAAPSAGTPPVVAYALERVRAGARQRVLVFGDADIFSTANAERRDPLTANGVMDAFHHLTEGAYPVQRTRAEPIDGTMTIEREHIQGLRWFFFGLLPLLIIGGGAYLLLSRRRR